MQTTTLQSMTTRRPNFVSIASRFLSYAELCRERAQQTSLSHLRDILQAQADRWEYDAKRVMRDAELVASSRIMLERVRIENDTAVEGVTGLPSPQPDFDRRDQGDNLPLIGREARPDTSHSTPPRGAE